MHWSVPILFVIDCRIHSWSIIAFALFHCHNFSTESLNIDCVLFIEFSSTGPFLDIIEKKWIVFQLLSGLDQSHSDCVLFIEFSSTRPFLDIIEKKWIVFQCPGPESFCEGL